MNNVTTMPSLGAGRLAKSIPFTGSAMKCSAGWPLLQSWCSRRCCDLTTLCVLYAIGSPGHSLEPLRLDGSTIDDTLAERAILYAAQRVADLFQQLCIVFGFGKFLRRDLVGDARVTDVMRRVDEFSPALVRFSAHASRQSFFKVEEALLVVLNIHDVLPANAANATATHLSLLVSLH